MAEHASGKPVNDDTGDIMDLHTPLGGHRYRHGRPRSWVLVGVLIAAFCIGGVAVIKNWWVVCWVCGGIVALCIPVGKIIGIMDDTVTVDQGPRTRAAVTGRDSAADPGVRLDRPS